jgi:hypothetical protein
MSILATLSVLITIGWRISVSIVIGLDDLGSIPGRGMDFSLCHHFQTGLGFTQPPIQSAPGVPSPTVQRPGCVADHSPPFSADEKNAWLNTSTPPNVHMVWYLFKAQGQTIPFQ